MASTFFESGGFRLSVDTNVGTKQITTLTVTNTSGRTRTVTIDAEGVQGNVNVPNGTNGQIIAVNRSAPWFFGDNTKLGFVRVQ